MRRIIQRVSEGLVFQKILKEIFQSSSKKITRHPNGNLFMIFLGFFSDFFHNLAIGSNTFKIYSQSANNLKYYFLHILVQYFPNRISVPQEAYTRDPQIICFSSGSSFTRYQFLTLLSMHKQSCKKNKNNKLVSKSYDSAKNMKIHIRKHITNI